MENPFLLQSLRCAFVFCLYFLTLASYLAPILIVKYWGNKTQLINSPSQAAKARHYACRVISWCNCTATGIFLSMCFLGLLPYVQEMFHTILKKNGYVVNFPLTESVVVIGYILTLLLEQSILLWQERYEASIQDDYEQNQSLLEECEMQEFSDDQSLLQKEQGHPLVTPLPKDSVCRESDAGVDVCIAGNNQSYGFSYISMLLQRRTGFPFFILAFATGLHSVFVGITLGLQSHVSKAVHIFVGIIIHECLIAIALGTSSTRLRYTFSAYLKFALLFSAAVPLGVVIGILIQHTPGTVGEVLSAVLQGLSAGIFLHVTFQDFLPYEFSNKKDRMLKVFFITLGFAIIAVVTLLLS